MIPKTEIAQRLSLFPEVVWDRFARVEDGSGCAFGWLERDDGRSDFFVLEWWENALEDGSYGFWSVTSSAQHSAEFSERLSGPDSGHADCQRVETHFPAVKNVVRLEPA
jgi:hypothetical protein